MTATVAQLAARALRKTGLSPVAVASRPSSGSTVTLAVIAANTLRLLGINPVAEASAAANSGTQAGAYVARRVLQRLGLTPVEPADWPASGSNVTVAVIAARVLRLLGANPISEADATANSGTTTVAAVATRALRRLNVVAADETPVTADTTLAEEKVTAVHEMLAATNLITWASSAIPNSVAEHYAIMAAHLIAPAFGQPQDAALFDAAFASVRSIALSGSAGQALAEAEVTAAHEFVRGMGFVTWATSAIPPSVASYYAEMAVARLSKAYGRDIPEDAYQNAANMVRRVELSGTTGQALALEHVTAVHDQLAGMNLITWASSVIPEFAVSHYVTMAASLMAPTVGLPADPAGSDAALATLRTLCLSGSAGQTLAEAEVTAAHQSLNSLGFVTWAISAIPEGASTHYATMAAARLAPAMGRPANDAGYASAVALVRQFAMAGATGQAIAEEKVRAAHYSLDARGMTRWTLADIPDYAEEPLVMMAAELLAPEVGQPPLPGLYLAGEREIRRVVAMPSSGTPVAAVYF